MADFHIVPTEVLANRLRRRLVDLIGWPDPDLITRNCDLYAPPPRTDITVPNFKIPPDLGLDDVGDPVPALVQLAALEVLGAIAVPLAGIVIDPYTGTQERFGELDRNANAYLNRAAARGGFLIAADVVAHFLGRPRKEMLPSTPLPTFVGTATANLFVRSINQLVLDVGRNAGLTGAEAEQLEGILNNLEPGIRGSKKVGELGQLLLERGLTFIAARRNHLDP